MSRCCPEPDQPALQSPGQLTLGGALVKGGQEQQRAWAQRGEESILGVPSTDLQGRRVAELWPSHKGYLLFQVVQPVAQLGLAGAEHMKRSGQRAWG